MIVSWRTVRSVYNPLRTLKGEAVSICETHGRFAEINLNAGCPSNKAKKQGIVLRGSHSDSIPNREVYRLWCRVNVRL